MRTLLATVLVVLATAAPLRAQTTPASNAARIDSLFRRWHSPESPGASVLVMHKGNVVHAKGYGMANLEHGVPNNAHTVFDIASVSKQFGAMAIALLEADGRLSLDDDVRKYIPELRDFGTPITLRHLVHHTSGIRDWPTSMMIGGWSYHDVISFQQILRFAFHQRDLNFKPGDAYAYSNTGYNLLADVVQRVSDKSFREFTEERIFKPLGMHDTHFHDDHTEIVLRRAESYRPVGSGKFAIVPNNLTALGSSSLFTTVSDLAKWVANFDSAIMGSRAVLARVHQRGVLNNGDTIPYAFGQNVQMERGHRVVSHTGSWAGYRSVLMRFPDEKLAIVILANTADMNPSQLATRISEFYLGERRATQASAASAAPVQNSNVWAPSSTELREFEGRYQSDELLTSWLLTVKDGKLVATHLRGGSTELRPRAKDIFQGNPFGEVQFLRDSSGQVTGFTANSARVIGLRFTWQR